MTEHILGILLCRCVSIWLGIYGLKFLNFLNNSTTLCTGECPNHFPVPWQDSLSLTALFTFPMTCIVSPLPD